MNAPTVVAPGQVAAQPRLPLSICLGWGIGTIAVAALFNSVNVLLLRYVVDYGGVSAAFAGMVIGLSKLYDAVIDPIIGSASDRCRSKAGRRRPFLIAGGVLLTFSALMLFNLPSGMSGWMTTVFFTAAVLLYATGYAVFSVPYMAMPAEMTPDYHERSRLISFRVAAVAIASLLGVFVGPVLMEAAGGGRDGYAALSWFLAALILASALICYHATAKAEFRPPSLEPEAELSWMQKLRMIGENRPFMLLLIIKLLQLMALALTQAAMPFLFRRVLGLDDTALGLYFLAFYGAMIVVQPIWVKAAKYRGKREVFIAATLFYALVYGSWYFVSPTEPSWLAYLRGALLGASGGAVLLLGQSLLPDTMEWDYRQTGLRREGVLSAVYTMCEKLAFAIGTALTGLLLGMTGYIQGAGSEAIEQPAAAIAAIYWLASILPMLVLFVSVIALLFYDLTEEKLTASEPA